MKVKKKSPPRRMTRWLVSLVGLVWLLTQLMTNLKVHQQQEDDQQQGEQDARGGQHDNSAATNTKDIKSQTSLDFHTSSAGCLLVMDDNHRLVEWLAYHHFTMNLRYLVVAVDPRSSKSPKPVLDRWVPLGLEYQIWTDEDYMGNRVFDKRQRLGELKRKQLTMVHRVRQKAFYQFCLEHLDAKGAGWTLLVDVDEYYVVSPDKVQDANQIMSSPGGLYQFVQETAKRATKSNSNPTYEQFQSPCVASPRLLFGAEEKQPSPLPASLPTLPNLYLDTTRWFYHAYYSEFDRNGLAKPMVDLHRIDLPKPHFLHPVNPHRPFQDLCRDPKKIYDIYQTALIRVHHYLSTWETYSFRNDSRKGAERTREAWEFRAYAGQVGPNTDIVPWLQGFVDHYGPKKAAQLLQGAGLSPTYTHAPNVNAEWKFEFLQDFLDPNNPKDYQSNYGKFLQNRTKKVGIPGG